MYGLWSGYEKNRDTAGEGTVAIAFQSADCRVLAAGRCYAA